MKAFILESYGANRALQLADVPEPQLRDDEVLVQVHAAGVNQLDSKIKDGQFKLILPYRLPLILGHDVLETMVLDVETTARRSRTFRSSGCIRRRCRRAWSSWR